MATGGVEIAKASLPQQRAPGVSTRNMAAAAPNVGVGCAAPPPWAAVLFPCHFFFSPPHRREMSESFRKALPHS